MTRNNIYIADIYKNNFVNIENISFGSSPFPPDKSNKKFNKWTYNNDKPTQNPKAPIIPQKPIPEIPAQKPIIPQKPIPEIPVVKIPESQTVPQNTVSFNKEGQKVLKRTIPGSGKKKLKTSSKYSKNKKSFGSILSIKDAMITGDGLSNIPLNSRVYFQTKKGIQITTEENELLTGVVMELRSKIVKIMLLGNSEKLNTGDNIIYNPKLYKQFNIKVSTNMLGNVITPLGAFINKRINNTLENNTHREKRVEIKAPGIMTRESITEALQTGLKVVDALLPIGRGQRELIIGDRQTGKTTIAIDTIINQKSGNSDIIDVFCIYVAIGQKRSSIQNIFEILGKFDAMNYTIIIAATASDSAALQFYAPYSGSAIGEFFRDAGEDALVIYDDLSKHAVAYRQLSLLLRRPPGREAYPGDIFYVHSRLLERSAKLNIQYGGGSLTALPIVETQGGDVAGYIPTNVISITDGQIFLEKRLFNEGIRPAVNVGLSVSRVGSAAQTPVMKFVSGSLKLKLAQYREIAGFSQLDADIDESTKNLLQQGKLAVEMLKQKQSQPLPVFQQAFFIFAILNGYESDLNNVSTFESDLLAFLDQSHLRDLFVDLTFDKATFELSSELVMNLFICVGGSVGEWIGAQFAKINPFAAASSAKKVPEKDPLSTPKNPLTVENQNVINTQSNRWSIQSWFSGTYKSNIDSINNRDNNFRNHAPYIQPSSDKDLLFTHDESIKNTQYDAPNSENIIRSDTINNVKDHDTIEDNATINSSVHENSTPHTGIISKLEDSDNAQNNNKPEENIIKENSKTEDNNQENSQNNNNNNNKQNEGNANKQNSWNRGLIIGAIGSGAAVGGLVHAISKTSEPTIVNNITNVTNVTNVTVSVTFTDSVENSSNQVSTPNNPVPTPYNTALTPIHNGFIATIIEETKKAQLYALQSQSASTSINKIEKDPVEIVD